MWWWVAQWVPQPMWQANTEWQANSSWQDARPQEQPQQGGGVTPRHVAPRLEKERKDDAWHEARKEGFEKSMKNAFNVLNLL